MISWVIVYAVIGVLWLIRIMRKDQITELERLTVVIVFLPVFVILLMVAVVSDWVIAQMKNKY